MVRFPVLFANVATPLLPAAPAPPGFELLPDQHTAIIAEGSNDSAAGNNSAFPPLLKPLKEAKRSKAAHMLPI